MKQSKKKWAVLVLASLLAIPALSCGSRKPKTSPVIDALTWFGGDNEIYRNVKKDGQAFIEYLETHDPNFKSYVCRLKSEDKLIVDAALRCQGN